MNPARQSPAAPIARSECLCCGACVLDCHMLRKLLVLSTLTAEIAEAAEKSNRSPRIFTDLRGSKPLTLKTICHPELAQLFRWKGLGEPKDLAVLLSDR